MQRAAWNVVWVVALIALAGCLSAEEAPGPDPGNDPPPGDSPRGAPDTKSSIEGVVLKDDFSIIKGARLQLSVDGQLVAETETDEQGRYAFTGLDSAEHLLQVSAPCCKAALYKLKPPPGGVYKHNIQLEELPSIVPYVVEDSWHGFIGCSAWIPQYGLLFNPDGACAQTDPNNDPILRLKIYPGLATVLAAMEWEQATTNVLDDLQLMMTKGQSYSLGDRFFTLSGPSPLEARLGPEDAVGGDALYFEKIAADGWDVRLVAAAGNSGNMVYQQPFTVHYRFYYLEPAPQGASALPT